MAFDIYLLGLVFLQIILRVKLPSDVGFDTIMNDYLQRVSPNSIKYLVERML